MDIVEGGGGATVETMTGMGVCDPLILLDFIELVRVRYGSPRSCVYIAWPLGERHGLNRVLMVRKIKYNQLKSK